MKAKSGKPTFNRTKVLRRHWFKVIAITVGVCVFTSLIVVMDVKFGREISLQKQSVGFEEGTGQVITSRKESSSGKRRTVKPKVEVEFVVGNHTHFVTLGTTIGLSASAYADAVLARFPLGATVPVFFNPEDPSEAVLERGVRSIDLFMILFAIPFNAAVIVALLVVIGLWKPTRLGSRQSDSSPFTRWATALGTSTVYGCAALVVGSLLCLFGFGLFTDLHFSVEIMWGAIYCLLAASALTFLMSLFKAVRAAPSSLNSSSDRAARASA